MNTLVNSYNQSDQRKYIFLKNSVNEARSRALKKRLEKEPFMTDLEYFLGAFLEMYEPHLIEVVHKLSERGYSIETTSGFGSCNGEYQSLDGYFTVDYVTRNKLEGNGVKIKENNGFKSLIFWAEKLDLDYIKNKWLHVIKILPDKGVLDYLTSSPEAIKFRRKYVSRNPIIQRQTLFEQLKFNIKKIMQKHIEGRLNRNSKPNHMEINLGIFIEELEPQVRQAVINMHSKGYSTDISGFTDNPSNQMIEGDFQLDEKCINIFAEMGVTVETNPSGYTKLQFAPIEANVDKIKKQWNQIVSILPNRRKVASMSMTKKARNFREKYKYLN